MNCYSSYRLLSASLYNFFHPWYASRGKDELKEPSTMDFYALQHQESERNPCFDHKLPLVVLAGGLNMRV